jgi:hypothetical protein
MSDEWVPSAAVLPKKPVPSEEQVEEIRACLLRVGIIQNPFAMSPVKRLAWLSESKIRALSVYAALRHVFFGEYQLQSFEQWAKDIGLPW